MALTGRMFAEFGTLTPGVMRGAVIVIAEVPVRRHKCIGGRREIPAGDSRYSSYRLNTSPSSSRPSVLRINTAASADVRFPICRSIVFARPLFGGADGGDELAGKIKHLIRRAQERGYLTYEELNAAMLVAEYTSEQIEVITALFQEKGIKLVEFPDDYPIPEVDPIDRETTCSRSISRIETALAALRHGKVRFACQLLEASSVELWPFADH